jgi:hypothetical protein
MSQKLADKPLWSDLDAVAARYPDVPRLIIHKTDVQRRGVFYADGARGAVSCRPLLKRIIHE